MSTAFSPKHHFNNNVLPLIESNNELKVSIQSILHFYEQQRLKLSELVADHNSQGENRELIKQIGDYPTLLKLLEFDLHHLRKQNKQMKQTLIGQSQKIQQLLKDPYMIETQNQLKQKLSQMEEKNHDSNKLINNLQQNLQNSLQDWKNQYHQLNETIQN